MIIAVLMGRKGSKGFPGKNTCNVLGKPLAYYPMNAAKGCAEIDQTYLSTDDEKLMAIARDNDVAVIKRPAVLCTDKALGEDVYVHAYTTIKKLHPCKTIEFIVLLMCNAPTLTSHILSEGIKVLREKPVYDSAVSVSKYNMWSPLRARKIGPDGLLHPFVPLQELRKTAALSCDRDSQGDVWFADMGFSIVRPRCFTNIKKGLLPQRWMGKKIYPVKQWGGLDVDYEWQIPHIEYWLKKNLLGKQK